eukprot:scaffold65680_cov30-Prasinocladus_malaysianus.AAC.1
MRVLARYEFGGAIQIYFVLIIVVCLREYEASFSFDGSGVRRVDDGVAMGRTACEIWGLNDNARNERLRHGYVATSNEPLKVGEVGEDGAKLESQYDVLNEQARLELKWFDENDMQDLVRGGQASCNQLVANINRMFIEYIRETWVPVTIFKLNQ